MGSVVPLETLSGDNIVVLQCHQRDTYRHLAIGTQFDLFEPRVVAAPLRLDAAVIQLPLWRREAEALWRSRVRETAATLSLRKTEEGRQNFWNRQVDWLWGKFIAMGMPEGSMRDEIDKFRQAVAVELARLHHHPERKGPGAA